MKTDEQLIWEAYQFPKYMSLNDIYGGLEDIPEDEALYHSVDPEHGYIKLPVITLSYDKLLELTTYQKDMAVYQAYELFADDDQKEIVEEYKKDKNKLYEQPVVVNINTALDGYHRIIAAIQLKTFLYAVDISDLEGVE